MPLISLKQKFQIDSTNTNPSNQTSLSYLTFAKAKVAVKYLNRTLQKDPANPNALLLKEKIKPISGN